MATIPRSLLNEYNQKISMLSYATKQVVLKQIAEIEYDSVAELREKLDEILLPYILASTEISASYAAQFYDDIRYEAISDTSFKAQVKNFTSSEVIKGSVKAILSFLNEQQGISSISKDLLDRVDLEIKKAAGDCVAYNGNNDSACIGWARVPSGDKTCEFCLMLASRGFEYGSSFDAGGGENSYHANCDCKIVPGFKGMEVEGYDPKALLGRYLMCYDTVAISGQASTKAVLAEMRKRDNNWLNTGEIPEITYEKGAKPLDKEEQVAKLLAEQGFNVKFLKPVNQNNVRTPDALVNGQKWEFKIPEVWHEKTVKNQFKATFKKGTSKLLISGTNNEAYTKSIVKQVQKLFDEKQFKEIDEVLILGFDGNIKRLKRY